MSIVKCKNKSSNITLINETKQILEKSYEEYQQKNIDCRIDVCEPRHLGPHLRT
jgi:hypothetical protein